MSNQPGRASSVVLVYFIGGCTYSEIAALRFLGKQQGMDNLALGHCCFLCPHSKTEAFRFAFVHLSICLSEKFLFCYKSEKVGAFVSYGHISSYLAHMPSNMYLTLTS